MAKSIRLSRVLIATISLLSFFLVIVVSGCEDNPFTDDFSETPNSTTGRIHDQAPRSEGFYKLRHPQLVEQALSSAAGKTSGTEAHVFIAFNMYEADGITPRILDKYGVTRRVLEQYGVTRRVLEQYGITPRVLEQYGITPRVLEQYGITQRVLEQYGITPRVLEQYGNLITDQLLEDFGITQEELEAQGITPRVLENYNTLAALLADHGLSAVTFDVLLEEYVRTLRLKVRIDEALPGIFVRLGDLPLETFIEEVTYDEDISFVEPDPNFEFQLMGRSTGDNQPNQMIPWNIERIGALTSGMNASGVHVYMLDSGIYDFDLNVAEQKDFTMLFLNRDVETYDDTKIIEVTYFDPGDDGDPYDHTGHGTHVAGIIGAENNNEGVLGVAPGVHIHSLKVLTEEGRTDITTVMSAIDYVIVQKQLNPGWPMVLNLSFGMNIESTAYNVLDEAVKQATDNGLVVVVSAGNDGADAATYSPAHVTEAITVGSYDMGDRFSDFSNYGSVVDLLAPGDFVVSLSNDPNDAADGWAIIESGTSMAAAHVTGAAALLLSENTNASPEDVQQGLQSTALAGIEGVPNGTTNKTVYVGEEGGLAGLEVPPFFQFAVTSEKKLEIKKQLYIGTEDGSETNTNVFTNDDLKVSSDEVQICGFGYYVGSARPHSQVENAFTPNYNPAGLPVHMNVDPIEIPSFKANDFKDVATIVTDKNLKLRGHYDLGTSENPVIWYVKGNLTTEGDVTFSGYGIFLVKKDIQIKHNMTSQDDPEETTIGLYTERSVQFKSENLNVSAQIFANKQVKPKGNTTIYGSITAGDKVDFSGGPTTIYYRPASAALTEPFWPVENYDNGSH